MDLACRRGWLPDTLPVRIPALRRTVPARSVFTSESERERETQRKREIEGESARVCERERDSECIRERERECE